MCSSDLVPPHLVAWIRGKTQGNPFFSQEVARSLREQGLVEVEKGAWLEAPTARSEERRVGKECRSRWSPDH